MNGRFRLRRGPAKASRPRKDDSRILKRNRIRRFDSAHVLAMLRKLPLQVAAGTIAAASAHIGALIARIRLVGREVSGSD